MIKVLQWWCTHWFVTHPATFGFWYLWPHDVFIWELQNVKQEGQAVLYDIT